MKGARNFVINVGEVIPKKSKVAYCPKITRNGLLPRPFLDFEAYLLFLRIVDYPISNACR